MHKASQTVTPISTHTGLGLLAPRQDQLKQALIDCLRSEKKDFLAIARHFYSHSHRSADDHLALARAIVDAVDHVLEQQAWEQSQFIRVTLKPLKEIRAQAQYILDQQSTLSSAASGSVQQRELAADECYVYMLLFQARGEQLSHWLPQLHAIERHLVARPIYQTEAAVEKLIRQKGNMTSEAYVKFIIKQSAIQSGRFETMRSDRNGSPLLTIQPGSVSADDIVEFVHQGRHYNYSAGKLILQH